VARETKKATSVAYWLFKEEPTHYSYADLERDGSTLWEGVKNPVARKHLRQVKPGDRVLFYHTGKEKAIVGEMRVTDGPEPNPASADPGAVFVRVEPVRRWPRPVTLAEVKRDEAFSSWELVRLPRLSVMPVSPEQWRRLEALGVSGGPQGP